jgi:hypothetical protein
MYLEPTIVVCISKHAMDLIHNKDKMKLAELQLRLAGRDADLQAVLVHPVSNRLFYNHLKTEHSSEHLLFFNAVMKYEDMYTRLSKLCLSTPVEYWRVIRYICLHGTNSSTVNNSDNDDTTMWDYICTTLSSIPSSSTSTMPANMHPAAFYSSKLPNVLLQRRLSLLPAQAQQLLVQYVGERGINKSVLLLYNAGESQARLDTTTSASTSNGASTSNTVEEVEEACTTRSTTSTSSNVDNNFRVHPLQDVTDADHTNTTTPTSAVSASEEAQHVNFHYLSLLQLQLQVEQQLVELKKVARSVVDKFISTANISSSSGASMEINIAEALRIYISEQSGGWISESISTSTLALAEAVLLVHPGNSATPMRPPTTFASSSTINTTIDSPSHGSNPPRINLRVDIPGRTTCSSNFQSLAQSPSHQLRRSGNSSRNVRDCVTCNTTGTIASSSSNSSSSGSTPTTVSTATALPTIPYAPWDLFGGARKEVLLLLHAPFLRFKRTADFLQFLQSLAPYDRKHTIVDMRIYRNGDNGESNGNSSNGITTNSNHDSSNTNTTSTGTSTVVTGNNLYTASSTSSTNSSILPIAAMTSPTNSTHSNSRVSLYVSHEEHSQHHMDTSSSSTGTIWRKFKSRPSASAVIPIN